MPVVTVPKVLREKLGEDGVDALVELLNRSQDEQKVAILEFVEEKFERRLTEELSKLRQEMVTMNASLREEMVTMNASLREEMVTINASLREEMAKNYSSIIKWMFIFWIGQVGVILGILFAFFK